MQVKWYHSASPTTGGEIDTSNLVGSLVEEGSQAAPTGDVAETLTSELDGGADTVFYRKIHAKNHEATEIRDPRLFFSMLSYPGQLSFARASDSDTSADNWTMPYGYEDEDFLSPNAIEDAVPLFADTSDLDAGDSAAIWLRFTIPDGMASDPSATGRINLKGNVA